MDFYVVPTLRHHEKLLQEGRQHQIDRPSWDRLFVEVVMRNESFSTEEKLEFIEDVSYPTSMQSSRQDQRNI